VSKIKKAAVVLGGRGMAIAGLVTGYVSLVLLALVFSLAMFSLTNNLTSARHTRVSADIQSISTQLMMYESMNGFYPTTAQGLKALVEQPETEPRRQRLMQFFKDIRAEPWKKNYI